jgi:membrane fusion protein (multidrug efflux system)
MKKSVSDFLNTNPKNKRKISFLILGMFIGVLGITFLTYFFFVSSKHVTTDNAYVGAEIAQVTPSIGGIVKAIHYKDTDVVKTGDVLVNIDDTDARLALARAKADLSKAQADLDRTKLIFDRRQALTKSGAVSAEEISNAKNAFKSAQAVFDAAQVSFEQAQVDLERTVIYSPIDGVIAKRQVQLGQRVQVGTTLMSVVPMLNMHVNANFKEVQLRKVQIGQPVELTADFYGSSVIYHGKVVGIAGGTGSAFAIIPAQNATGNWIKVVQRLPVRVELRAEELKEHPLQVGLSMQVDIDVSNYKK